MDAASKAAIIAACEENYSGYSEDALEAEVIRQIKMRKDHAQTRKDYMDTYKDLVDECDLKIDYIIGRIGDVQHEAAVQNQLENTENV